MDRDSIEKFSDLLATRDAGFQLRGQLLAEFQHVVNFVDAAIAHSFLIRKQDESDFRTHVLWRQSEERKFELLYARMVAVGFDGDLASAFKGSLSDARVARNEVAHTSILMAPAGVDSMAEDGLPDPDVLRWQTARWSKEGHVAADLDLDSLRADLDLVVALRDPTFLLFLAMATRSQDPDHYAPASLVDMLRAQGGTLPPKIASAVNV